MKSERFMSNRKLFIVLCSILFTLFLLSGQSIAKTAKELDASADAASASESPKSKTTQGVQWESKPDPMDTVKKGADSVKKGAVNVLDSMEGKTVSMKTYVGSIVGVIILMMLARCGG